MKTTGQAQLRDVGVLVRQQVLPLVGPIEANRVRAGKGHVSADDGVGLRRGEAVEGVGVAVHQDVGALGGVADEPYHLGAHLLGGGQHLLACRPRAGRRDNREVRTLELVQGAGEFGVYPDRIRDVLSV